MSQNISKKVLLTGPKFHAKIQSRSNVFSWGWGWGGGGGDRNVTPQRVYDQGRLGNNMNITFFDITFN